MGLYSLSFIPQGYENLKGTLKANEFVCVKAATHLFLFMPGRTLYVDRTLNERKENFMREESFSNVKARPLIWMIAFSTFWFLIMILLLGTRRGEHKARLSSKDLGTLTEIANDRNVTEATITNLRTLCVVVQDPERSHPQVLARQYCQVTKKNEALVDVVRIVQVDQSVSLDKTKPNFVLLGECNCADIRIR